MTRTCSWHRELGVVGVALVLIGPADAGAQDPPASPPPASAQEKRSTGLPSKVRWTFNFDAGLGTFGFGNSLYTDVRPDPSGNLSDNWAESYAKPALTADLGLGTSRLYGKVSVIGERTFMAPPSLVGEGASSFQAEDLYLGWRSGMTLGNSEDLLDITVGRAPYTIGHGLLLWDGAGDGASRGGLWSNVRTAWALAAIARLKPKNHAVELFYLERDDLPEDPTGTRVWGLNYDLTTEASTFGASYLRLHADPAELPERNGMTVFNVRAYTAPAPTVPDLSFEFEYAREQNGDLLRSDAWTLLAGYRLSQVAWTPRLSYRYAFFEGDDPETPTNESFDMLLPGFYDWGTWWQGEIAGEYFLANSNLVSHQVRLHTAPTEAIGTGLILYRFLLDKPAALDPAVTSKNLAVELDWYMDWDLNGNFTVSFVGAYANPKTAVQQAYDRTKSFWYGMAYVVYSY